MRKILVLVLFPVLLLSAAAALSADTPASAPEPSIQQSAPTFPGSENLELVGHVGGSASAVATAGGYTYLAVGPQLVVVDVSDPANPQPVGSLILPTTDLVGTLMAAGHYVYATAGKDLWIIDVSSPTNPVQAGLYSAPHGINDAAIDGTHAYLLVDGGLLVIDVSNPATPVQASSYQTPGSAVGIDVANGYAYIADGDLQVVNISNPAQPTAAGSYSCYSGGHHYGTYDVAVAGNYVYLPALSVTYQSWYSYWDYQTFLFDPSNPTDPIKVPDLDFQIDDMLVAADWAYFVDDGSVSIFDISDPMAPSHVGDYDPAGRRLGHSCSRPLCLRRRRDQRPARGGPFRSGQHRRGGRLRRCVGGEQGRRDGSARLRFHPRPTDRGRLDPFGTPTREGIQIVWKC